MTPLSTNMPSAPLGRTHDAAPRLRLRPDTEASGYVDATWWPRSNNLVAEILGLITAFRERAGPIGRIVYDPRAWLPTGRHFLMADRSIRLDRYPFELFGTMYLCGTDGTVIVLQAIASGTEPLLARSALAAAGSAASTVPGRS
ncbi:DUF5994 family protein [Nocardia nova]|jgi:hypothetical protein|uniref:DUF5994 family protein n=1 Tax=Nocardia nova TaxID=37330 RepID=UPI0018932FB7|nr:DUF5994 family protein [Nocardia nova]MBF6147615.1 hypothetical protein [Nocardia nova]